MTVGLEHKSIAGRKYEFQKFGAKKSVKLLTRLLKLVGEPLSIAVGATGGGKLFESNLDPKILSSAVRVLVDKLDEDEVLDLIEEFTANDNVLCDGVRVNFDNHYEGKLPELFKVLAAALEVQYGNFFGEYIGVTKKGTIKNKNTTLERAT